MTLPYDQGVTDSLVSILCAEDTIVQMWSATLPHKMIHDILVAPKDIKDKMNMARVIYTMHCGGCNSDYVGEIGHPFKKTLSEQHRDSSLVFQHTNDMEHTVDYGQVKVLKQELW